jgi:restriction endonuclease S subunit
MGLIFDTPTMPQFRELELSTIATSFSLRCDAKQGQERFLKFEEYINSIPHFELGSYLPNTLVKGSQPIYIEDIDASGVPVINTLSVRNLKINTKNCRLISEEQFDELDDSRKCKVGDVLLTVDGGTSIGKTVLFELEGNYTVDSHVSILRPKGISPLVLVYLLASPIGQLQFQKAESGASGQTGVTEDDIRRFKFPLIDKDTLEERVAAIDTIRLKIEKRKKKLEKKLKNAWLVFSDEILEYHTNPESIEVDPESIEVDNV